MAPLGNIPFIGPQEYDWWYHVCSVVALDWVDLTNVTCGIFIVQLCVASQGDSLILLEFYKLHCQCQYLHVSNTM